MNDEKISSPWSPKYANEPLSMRDNLSLSIQFFYTFISTPHYEMVMGARQRMKDMILRFKIFDIWHFIVWFTYLLTDLVLCCVDRRKAHSDNICQ